MEANREFKEIDLKLYPKSNQQHLLRPASYGLRQLQMTVDDNKRVKVLSIDGIEVIARGKAPFINAIAIRAETYMQGEGLYAKVRITPVRSEPVTPSNTESGASRAFYPK